MTEKRFKEIISTQKVIDTQTSKEYDCLLDNDLFELINEIAEENIRLKKERNHFERKKTEYLTEWNNCRIQNTELKKDNHELKEAMKRMMIEMMGGKMND